MHRLGSLLAHPSRALPRGAYAVLWAVAVALAVGGGLLHLVLASSTAWYLGLLLAVPVLWLAAEHLLREDNDIPLGEGPYAAP